jgi:hypothetical protein
MEKEMKQLTDDMDKINNLNEKVVKLITANEIDKALKELKKCESHLEVNNAYNL